MLKIGRLFVCCEFRKWDESGLHSLEGCRATAAATVFVDELVGGARGAREAHSRQVRAASVPRLLPLGHYVLLVSNVALTRVRCS